MIYIGYEEKWKTLKYKNKKTKYSISTFGRIRNDKTGRILIQFIQNDGYYGFTISIKNKAHSLKTARVVAEHFIENPDPDNKIEVNHIRGSESKNDNSIYNLEWVTPEENKEKAHELNLYKGHPGEDNPNSKYSNEQIHEVCQLLEENEFSPEEIQSKSGVKIETIADIFWLSRWRTISKYYNVKNYDKLPVNSSKKFSYEQIYEACCMIDQGYKNKEIIKRTKISKDSVKRLRSGKTYHEIAYKFKFYRIKHPELFE